MGFARTNGRGVVSRRRVERELVKDNQGGPDMGAVEGPRSADDVPAQRMGVRKDRRNGVRKGPVEIRTEEPVEPKPSVQRGIDNFLQRFLSTYALQYLKKLSVTNFHYQSNILSHKQGVSFDCF